MTLWTFGLNIKFSLKISDLGWNVERGFVRLSFEIQVPFSLSAKFCFEHWRSEDELFLVCTRTRLSEDLFIRGISTRAGFSNSSQILYRGDFLRAELFFGFARQITEYHFIIGMCKCVFVDFKAFLEFCSFSSSRLDSSTPRFPTRVHSLPAASRRYRECVGMRGAGHWTEAARNCGESWTAAAREESRFHFVEYLAMLPIP